MRFGKLGMSIYNADPDDYDLHYDETQRIEGCVTNWDLRFRPRLCGLFSASCEIIRRRARESAEESLKDTFRGVAEILQTLNISSSRRVCWVKVRSMRSRSSWEGASHRVRRYSIHPKFRRSLPCPILIWVKLMCGWEEVAVKKSHQRRWVECSTTTRFEHSPSAVPSSR